MSQVHILLARRKPLEKGVSAGIKNPVSGFRYKAAQTRRSREFLVAFCDIRIVLSVWVFKRKWYGWHLIVEFEQDTGAVWRD